MDLFPEDWISLSQGNGRSLELAFRVFQVFVYLDLVIEIEGNGPVDLRALEEWKVFLNSLGRLAFVESVNYRIQGDAESGQIRGCKKDCVNVEL